MSSLNPLAPAFVPRISPTLPIAPVTVEVSETNRTGPMEIKDGEVISSLVAPAIASLFTQPDALNSETPWGRLRDYLIRSGIIDTDGTPTGKVKPPIPGIFQKQIDRFNQFFYGEYVLSVPIKDRKRYFITLRPLDLLRKLGYKNFEIVGSGARWILGVEFFEAYLKSLNVPKHLITPELLQSIVGTAADIDVRLKIEDHPDISKSDTPLTSALNALTKEILSHVPELLHDTNVRFSRWMPKKTDPNQYVPVTLQFYKKPRPNELTTRAFDLDILLVHSLERNFLGYPDSLGVKYTFNSQKRFSVVCRSSCIDKALIDTATKSVDTENPETFNESGLAALVKQTSKGCTPKSRDFFKPYYEAFQKKFPNANFAQEVYKHAGKNANLNGLLATAFNLSLFLSHDLWIKILEIIPKKIISEQGFLHEIAHTALAHPSKAQFIPDLLLLHSFLGIPGVRCFLNQKLQVVEMAFLDTGPAKYLFIDADINKAFENITHTTNLWQLEHLSNSWICFTNFDGLFLPHEYLPSIITLFNTPSQATKKLAFFLLLKLYSQRPNDDLLQILMERFREILAIGNEDFSKNATFALTNILSAFPGKYSPATITEICSGLKALSIWSIAANGSKHELSAKKHKDINVLLKSTFPGTRALAFDVIFQAFIKFPSISRYNHLAECQKSCTDLLANIALESIYKLFPRYKSDEISQCEQLCRLLIEYQNGKLDEQAHAFAFAETWLRLTQPTKAAEHVKNFKEHNTTVDCTFDLLERGHHWDSYRELLQSPVGERLPLDQQQNKWVTLLRHSKLSFEKYSTIPSDKRSLFRSKLTQEEQRQLTDQWATEILKKEVNNTTTGQLSTLEQEAGTELLFEVLSVKKENNALVSCWQIAKQAVNQSRPLNKSFLQLIANTTKSHPTFNEEQHQAFLDALSTLLPVLQQRNDPHLLDFVGMCVDLQLQLQLPVKLTSQVIREISTEVRPQNHQELAACEQMYDWAVTNTAESTSEDTCEIPIAMTQAYLAAGASEKAALWAKKVTIPHPCIQKALKVLSQDNLWDSYQELLEETAAETMSSEEKAKNWLNVINRSTTSLAQAAKILTRNRETFTQASAIGETKACISKLAQSADQHSPEDALILLKLLNDFAINDPAIWESTTANVLKCPTPESLRAAWKALKTPHAAISVASRIALIRTCKELQWFPSSLIKLQDEETFTASIYANTSPEEAHELRALLSEAEIWLWKKHPQKAFARVQQLQGHCRFVDHTLETLKTEGHWAPYRQLLAGPLAQSLSAVQQCNRWISLLVSSNLPFSEYKNLFSEKKFLITPNASHEELRQIACRWITEIFKAGVNASTLDVLRALEQDVGMGPFLDALSDIDSNDALVYSWEFASIALKRQIPINPVLSKLIARTKTSYANPKKKQRRTLLDILPAILAHLSEQNDPMLLDVVRWYGTLSLKIKLPAKLTAQIIKQIAPLMNAQSSVETSQYEKIFECLRTNATQASSDNNLAMPEALAEAYLTLGVPEKAAQWTKILGPQHALHQRTLTALAHTKHWKLHQELLEQTSDKTTPLDDWARNWLDLLKSSHLSISQATKVLSAHTSTFMRESTKAETQAYLCQAAQTLDEQSPDTLIAMMNLLNSFEIDSPDAWESITAKTLKCSSEKCVRLLWKTLKSGRAKVSMATQIALIRKCRDVKWFPTSLVKLLNEDAFLRSSYRLGSHQEICEIRTLLFENAMGHLETRGIKTFTYEELEAYRQKHAKILPMHKFVNSLACNKALFLEFLAAFKGEPQQLGQDFAPYTRKLDEAIKQWVIPLRDHSCNEICINILTACKTQSNTKTNRISTLGSLIISGILCAEGSGDRSIVVTSIDKYIERKDIFRKFPEIDSVIRQNILRGLPLLIGTWNGTPILLKEFDEAYDTIITQTATDTTIALTTRFYDYCILIEHLLNSQITDRNALSSLLEKCSVLLEFIIKNCSLKDPEQIKKAIKLYEDFLYCPLFTYVEDDDSTLELFSKHLTYAQGLSALDTFLALTKSIPRYARQIDAFFNMKVTPLPGESPSQTGLACCKTIDNLLNDTSLSKLRRAMALFSNVSKYILHSIIEKNPDATQPLAYEIVIKTINAALTTPLHIRERLLIMTSISTFIYSLDTPSTYQLQLPSNKITPAELSIIIQWSSISPIFLRDYIATMDAIASLPEITESEIAELYDQALFLLTARLPKYTPGDTCTQPEQVQLLIDFASYKLISIALQYYRLHNRKIDISEAVLEWLSRIQAPVYLAQAFQLIIQNTKDFYESDIDIFVKTLAVVAGMPFDRLYVDCTRHLAEASVATPNAFYKFLKEMERITWLPENGTGGKVKELYDHLFRTIMTFFGYEGKFRVETNLPPEETEKMHVHAILTLLSITQRHSQIVGSNVALDIVLKERLKFLLKREDVEKAMDICIAQTPIETVDASLRQNNAKLFAKVMLHIATHFSHEKELYDKCFAHMQKLALAIYPTNGQFCDSEKLFFLVHLPKAKNVEPKHIIGALNVWLGIIPLSAFTQEQE